MAHLSFIVILVQHYFKFYYILNIFVWFYWDKMSSMCR